MRIGSLAALVLCSVALAGSAGGEQKGENLDGTWLPVSIEIGGKKEPDKEHKGDKLIIQGDRFTMLVGKDMIKGTFKVDRTSKPRTIDAYYEAEKDKKVTKVTVLAIYELKGDLLWVCGADPGKPRPKEFKTTKEDGHELTIYK